jgi:hypothetical protein
VATPLHLGILLAVTGNLLIACSLSLQKWVHNEVFEQERRAGARHKQHWHPHAQQHAQHLVPSHLHRRSTVQQQKKTVATLPACPAGHLGFTPFKAIPHRVRPP